MKELGLGLVPHPAYFFPSFITKRGSIGKIVLKTGCDWRILQALKQNYFSEGMKKIETHWTSVWYPSMEITLKKITLFPSKKRF